MVKREQVSSRIPPTAAVLRWPLPVVMAIFLLTSTLRAAEPQPQSEPTAEQLQKLRDTLPAEQRQAAEPELAGLAQLIDNLFGPKGLQSMVPKNTWPIFVNLSITARAQTLAANFDVDRLFDSVKVAWENQAMVADPRFRKGYSQAFCKNLVQQSMFTEAESHQVKRLEIDVAKGEGAVVVGHRLPNYYVKVRSKSVV